MTTSPKRESGFDPYDISKDDDFIKEETKKRFSKKNRKFNGSITKECMLQKQEIIPGVTLPAAANDLFVVTENGEFLCATCPRAFKSLVGRQRHMNKCATAVETMEVTCPCCNEAHDKAHKEGNLVCTECSGKFADDNALKKHMATLHQSTDTFGCAVCPSRFATKPQLVIHLYAHSDEKPWMCKTCNAVFTRKYHLERHFRQSGCDGQPRSVNSCQVCGREFTRKDNLREHLRSHAGMNKRLTIYTCEFCGVDVAGLHNYNEHKRENHVGDKPYKCSYCPMYFRVSGAMKKHMRKHTGEKPYECRECFKKFAAKETLNRHMKTHTSERPFVCSYCAKGFIQAAQLRAHLFHHTGDFGYECKKCHRKFNRKIRLTTHMKYDHNGKEPFECDSCHKQYLLKNDLEKHILSHTREKKFPCIHCGKSFAQKAYLKMHLLTHSKETPRSCNYCNRAFIRQDCLLRHMRAKHREKLERILIEAERKKLQLQLLTITSKESTVVAKEPAEDLAAALPGAISDLLSILVDEETLAGFGAPDAPVDEVLNMVIKRCGHNAIEDPELSVLDRLRENAKLLFTVVIDDAGVKALLNNQSVDEVISHVLDLVKS